MACERADVYKQVRYNLRPTCSTRPMYGSRCRKAGVRIPVYKKKKKCPK